MSLFTDLLRNPATRRRYVVILEPAIDAIGTVQAIYLSEDGFVSGPSDTPANTYFAPRLAAGFAFRFVRSLVSGARLGGRSVPNYGSLAFSNADGGLDAWLGYGWDTRRVRVLLGGDGFSLGDFGLIFDGQAIALSADPDGSTLNLELRDRSYLFEVPLQAAKYGGTGGLDGGADLAGKGKPVLYGDALNIEPVVVDRPNLKLHWHDGAAEDVPALRDRGSGLTRVTGTPTAGQYKPDAATATITLGGSPAAGSVITCDARGDKRGGTWRTTVADIIREIAVTRRGLVDPTDLDTSSFTALNAVAGGVVGLWLPDGSVMTIAEAFDVLVNSVGGYWGLRRDGRLQVGRIAPPSGSPVANFGPTDILALRPMPTVLPLGRLVVGYARNWRVQTEAELAGLAWTNGARDFATQEYRLTAAATNAGALAKHPQARDERMDTLLRDLADAIIVRDFLLTRDGPDPQVFEAVLKTQPLVLDIGDEVALVDERYGLASGAGFRILKTDEESAASQVTAVVWRPNV